MKHHLTALISCLLLCAHVVATAAEKPNIVFIFTDDHSIQTIGAYQSRLSEYCKKNAITPNIDKLAAEGGLFVNSFCGNSLCSPSRAAILTGLHSHANGVRNLTEGITPGVWTFPTTLRAAGYQTAVFGKWHLASNPEYETWKILPDQGAYENPKFLTPQGEESIPGYATDIITDLSLDWLEKRDKTKPFFLAVQHKAPHRNWIPPVRLATWLDGIEIPEPATLFDNYENRASGATNQQMEIDSHMTMASDLKVGEKFAKDPRYAARNADFAKRKPEGKDLVRWKYQEYVKDYLRCVHAVDESVGRIDEALKKAGLSENTIVIYSSDQGFFMGEHGWFDKRWIYEESLHMPFIIRWPGVVKPSTRFAEFIQNIDYAPTFVEIAGGKPQAGLHGKSFVPVLKGETPADWRSSVYYHYYDPGHNVPVQYGVRTDHFTLAHYPKTNEWELFDMAKDPQQLRSVFSDPDYATKVTELKTELTRLRAQYNDTEELAPSKQGKKKGP